MRRLLQVFFVTGFVLISIRGNAQNVAISFLSNQGPCVPATVQLESTVPNTASVMWTITYPDSSVTSLNTGPVTTFVATMEGEYCVDAIIYLSDGTTVPEQMCFDIYPKPVITVSSTGQLSGCAPLDVSFSAAGTVGTQPLTYAWDFCDGGTSDSLNAIHSFTQQGCYCVGLVVTDAQGCVADTVIPDYVCVTTPQANISVTPASGCCPVNITIANSSVNTTSHEWIVLKDGQPFFTSNFRSLGSSLPSFMWSGGNASSPCGSPDGGPGVYTFIYIATGSNAVCSDTMIKTVTINGTDPEFTALPSTGCAPLPVQFSDYSPQSVTTWSWNFGDASSGSSNISTEQNPIHVFNVSGSYEVSLCVTDVSGCSLCETQTLNIGGPSANIYATDTVLCNNDSAFFTSQVTGIPIVNYSWDFGDGNTSNNTHAYHSYDSTGNYTVRLVVTDASGCTDTVTKTDYVYAEHVDPDFSVAYPGGLCAPALLIFTNQTSGYDIGWTSEWFLNNSYFIPETDAEYVENLLGCQSVFLKVTTPMGCSATIFDPCVVSILPALAQVTTSAASGCAPFCVTFDANYNSSVVSHLWCSGDGLLCDSLINSLTHCYQLADTFYATLTVCDSTKCCQAYIPALYSDTAIASFQPSQTSVCNHNTLSFTDVSFGITDVVSWQWDFGDGSFSMLQHPGHVYADTGCYDVSLIVTTAAGCTDTTTLNDICVLPDVVASFTSTNPFSCSSPFEVCFYADSTVSSLPVSYDWFFGSGPVIPPTDPSPCVVYNSQGSFPVQLIAVNSAGCADTVYDPVYVNIGSASVSLNASSDSVFVNQPVAITSSNAASYEWSVTPTVGFSVTGTTFHAQFSNAGVYTVCVTATMDNGCTAAACHSIIVTDTITTTNSIQVESDGFEVFPNPAYDVFSITIESPLSHQAVLSLMSVDGKRLVEKTVTLHKGKTRIDADATGLSDGIYIVQLTSGEARRYRRLVIQR